MRKLTGLFFAFLLMAAAGCSQAPTDSADANPLDLAFGGVTTDNEAPAFGDADLLATATTGIDPADPVAASIAAESTGDGVHAVFALRAVWGQLRYDSTSTMPTVWDGSVAVDSGRIGVARLIRFEPGQDYLLPRTAPNVVEFVSNTTVHHDGLLLLIGVNTALLADSSDNLVTFATGPLTISFKLRQLVALDTTIRVDDAGNAVMFNGFLVRPDDCPKGFLSGKWMVTEDGDGGEFRGGWISRNGELEGYLMGNYGIDSDGRRVFFGKYVDVNGTFEGRLRGVWGPAPLPARGGFFKGVFYDPQDRPAGRLRGFWKADEAGAGHFEGVWRLHCPRWDAAGTGWERWDDPNFDDASLGQDGSLGGGM